MARHVAESLEPAAWLKKSGCSRWVDLGSGAGFPAIPLALAGVGKHWTLVESRRPKILFLRKMLADLSITGVEVVHSRIETAELPDEFDGFTARAVERLPAVLMAASVRVADGGSAFLWKGSAGKEEMEKDESWRPFWTFVGDMPLGTTQANVVMFKRNKR